MLKSFYAGDDRLLLRMEDGRNHALPLGHIRNEALRPDHLAVGHALAANLQWLEKQQQLQRPWAQIADAYPLAKFIERAAADLRTIRAEDRKHKKNVADFLGPTSDFSEITELLLVQEADKLPNGAARIEWGHTHENRGHVLLKHPGRFGVNADGLERSILARNVERSFSRSMQASSSRQDPLGRRSDPEAAKALANATMAAFERVESDIEAAATWLSTDAVNHVMLLSDRSADQIWNAVVEKAAA